MMSYDDLLRIALEHQREQIELAEREHRLKEIRGANESLLRRLGKAYSALLSILA
jgi:hypothetical protein